MLDSASAQRAHANYTETLTHATAAILFAGLRFPRTAAALGAGWTLARFVYAKGYTSSSGPKGRVAYVFLPLSVCFGCDCIGY